MVHDCINKKLVDDDPCNVWLMGFSFEPEIGQWTHKDKKDKKYVEVIAVLKYICYDYVSDFATQNTAFTHWIHKYLGDFNRSFLVSYISDAT